MSQVTDTDSQMEPDVSLLEVYRAALIECLRAPDKERQAGLAALADVLTHGRLGSQDIQRLHATALRDIHSQTVAPGPYLDSALEHFLTDLLIILSSDTETAERKKSGSGTNPELDRALLRVVQTGPLGVMISRIRDDEIIMANQTLLGLLGFGSDELVGRTTIELGLFAETDRAREQGPQMPATRDFETRLRTKSGEICHVLSELEIIDLMGEPCFLRTVFDITERRRVQERLLESAMHGALHDPLTNLPNRSLFLELLERSFNRALRRPDYYYAVLFLDLDFFKEINDKFGHGVGDRVLQTIARRLERSLQPGDTAARLSGDEFAILIDDFRDASDLLRFARNLNDIINAPIQLDGHQISTTASVGIALSTTRYKNPQDILNDADKAMYRAKAHGRARHEVFDEEIHERAMARLKLRSDLEWAIGHTGFSVYYQPIISLESGKIVRFEALGRWQHPDHGLLSPADFIPMAEETGLILDIGHWMLQEACGQIRAWNSSDPAQPSLGVSINLSLKEFRQPDLTKIIEDGLKLTGLDPGLLSLEIREGVIMAAPDESAAIISELRDLGAKVYIDDFGTGHSSLSFMYSFPIDALKIARSFTTRIGSDGKNSEIVRTIVMLARDFGLQVVAEGVENAGQLSLLRQLNCSFAQGFYFAKPLTSEAAQALFRKNPRW
jgi:diguanylate cyclase (GGDEF)-like protein/PAS domain S-box-containing protein